MGIQKALLDPFSQTELIQFVDNYIQTGNYQALPDHSEDECVKLAMFFGFGFKRSWSEDEIRTLTDNYPSLGSAGCANLLPYRSELDCKNKAQGLGLKTQRTIKRVVPSYWKNWEIDILIKYYPFLGGKIAALLPDRSESSCIHQAQRMGIANPNAILTVEDVELIRKEYPVIGSEVCKKLHNRSRQAVSRMASALGINAPQQQWTESEDELLTERYPKMGRKVASLYNGTRTESACITRAYQLGLQYDRHGSKWSEKELSILDREYPHKGVAVCELLPGRSENACRNMAKRRNLLTTTPSPRPRKPWTPEEDSTLTLYYPQMGAAVATLISNRTPSACINRAVELGLHRENIEWSSDEKRILRVYYHTEGQKAFERLPNRTYSACMSMVREMGLSVRSIHQLSINT